MKVIMIQKSKIIKIIGGLVLLMLGVGLILFIKNSEKTKERSDGPKISQAENNRNGANSKFSVKFPSCGDKKDFFTVSPIKSGDYGPIIPLGNLNPTGHVFPTDHIYVFSKVTLPSGRGDPSLRKPVYAPGDIWITKLYSSEQIGGITDYGLTYKPCDEFEGQFGHMGSITEKLKTEIEKNGEKKCNEYETGGDKYRSCVYQNLKIKVSAGEEIGTAFDGRSAALDIWATDMRKDKIKFANPTRWRETSFYNVCPADYFVENTKTEMMIRFGDYDGKKRIKEPICGTIDVDIVGTAKGHWFSSDHTENSTEDKNMALVNNNTSPEIQAFSMGNSGESKGFKSGVYFFYPKSSGNTNLDFSLVKPGSSYCYETTDSPNAQRPGGVASVIYLFMPDANTIRVEKSTRTTCGIGPWAMKNFIEFIR